MRRIDRERFVNAVLFFAKNTRFCGKIKLFKLLYLLDFEHFKLTGKSVTSLDYQAWKFGPVPVELMQEWEALGPDLGGVVHIEAQRVIDHVRQAVVPNDGAEFDDDSFSRRQLAIMERLAEEYKETLSPSMIDVTHQLNGAWHRVWRDGEGAFDPIPYELSLDADDPNREVILQVAEEQAMRNNALRYFESDVRH